MKRTALSALCVFAVCGISTAYAFSIKGPEKTIESPTYRVRGTNYIPLTLICDAYGIEWKWDPASMIAELNKKNATIRLRVGEYKVDANGAISIAERPVVVHKGAVCIPSSFLRTVFDKFFLVYSVKAVSDGAIHLTAGPPPDVYRYKIKKIVLDAGHGGYDPGAIGRSGIKEKYITLDIAKKVKDLLEGKGIEVILTRSDDTFVPLVRRAEIANSSNADLFISIHANASKTRRLKGFEVYYLSEAIDEEARAQEASDSGLIRIEPSSVYERTDILNYILWDLELTENRKEAIGLGNRILDSVDVLKRDIKCARFVVLKGTRMPAVLVEVGYISNSSECSKLGWGEYRTKIAAKIADGVLKYKKEFEDSGGATY